jgi:hypothetical protein
VFGGPFGVATDGAGNVYVADSGSCDFNRRHERWVMSTRHNTYAMAGQTISLGGSAGGNYVVDARIGKDGKVSCAERHRHLGASIADTMGTTVGVNLAGACVVETLGASYNATGMLLQNNANLSVCSSNDPAVNPQPDGAQFVNSPPLGVFCYTGTGAGLNDLDGIERDWTGNYLTDEAYCHVVWSGGVAVPAAKRPAVRSWPLPKHVDPHSPIVWRPVATGVAIANG